MVETELKLCKFVGSVMQLSLSNYVASSFENILFCISLGDPHNDPNAQGDAFKTLFVARVVSVSFPSPVVLTNVMSCIVHASWYFVFDVEL